MGKLSTALLFFVLGSAIASAGTGPGAVISKYSKIPFLGRDSSIFLYGLKQCARFADKSKADRCAALTGCEERGTAALRPLIDNPGADLPSKYENLEALGDLYAYGGDRFEQAVKAYEEMLVAGRKLGKQEEWTALTKLGQIHMLAGERQNCVSNHNEDSCLFPLSLKAQYARKELSRKAIAFYRRALEIEYNPHLAWLYNFTHMTIGTYPTEVPKKWRLPEKFLKSATSFPRFYDIAGKLGLQRDAGGGGGNAAIDDFNNDGFLDVVMGQRLACRPTSFYLNNGAALKDESKSSGLAQELGVTNVLQADYDNDGDLDLYVTRGAWDRPGLLPPVYNTLLENNGKGIFKDVTEARGLRGENNSNIASVWTDFDNNGWVDLFVCNELRGGDLFLNEGGKFTNKIGASGIVYDGVCKGAAAGDVDNDGDSDLFLSVYGRPNRLFLNDGKGRFTAVKNPALEKKPALAFASWFFDFDNDGWLDIFVSSWHRDMQNYSAYAFGQKHDREVPRLFRNNKGKFSDISEAVGLKAPTPAMGAGFGDLTGDGFPDVILGNGSAGIGDVVPNVIYENKGGKKLVDVSWASGMSNLQKGHGIAVADLDNDGDQDVFHVLGGAFPADGFFPSLFENPGFGHRHLTLKLEGTKSNRAAIGARVKVSVEENRRERNIFKTVGMHSSFGNQSLRLNIGLGKAGRIKQVEVRWPNLAASTEIFKGFEPNGYYHLKEGTGRSTRLDLSKVEWKSEGPRAHQHH